MDTRGDPSTRNLFLSTARFVRIYLTTASAFAFRSLCDNNPFVTSRLEYFLASDVSRSFFVREQHLLPRA